MRHYRRADSLNGKMPRQKKTKTKTRNKGDGSSSSESEYSRTLDIITKLSQKYLSAEGGYDGDGENSTETTDSSQKSSSAYDFDEPDYLSMDVSPKLKMNSRGKKLPTNVQNNKRKKKENKSKKSKESIVKAPQNNNNTSIINTMKAPDKNLKKDKSLSVSIAESPMFSRSPVVSLQRLDISNIEGYDSFKRDLRKRKVDSTENLQTKKLCKPEKKSAPAFDDGGDKRVSRHRDSGVIMSPPSTTPIQSSFVQKDVKSKSTPCPNQSRKRTINSKQRAASASTPVSVDNKPKLKIPKFTLNESCFGFNGLKTPGSMCVSPVVKGSPITPLSDYASMDSISLNQSSMERSYSKRKSCDKEPELFSMEDFSFNKSATKSYKPSKKKRSGDKKQAYKPVIDKIADRMNDEFDEIEKFQLSIEDV